MGRVGRPPTKGSFKKGQSGNPKGRPPVPAEVKEIAKAASPKAMARAVELLDHPDARVVMSAIKEIIDRAYGTPRQSVEVSGPDGGPQQHEYIDRPPRETFEEWEARRKKELEKK